MRCLTTGEIRSLLEHLVQDTNLEAVGGPLDLAFCCNKGHGKDKMREAATCETCARQGLMHHNGCFFKYAVESTPKNNKNI